MISTIPISFYKIPTKIPISNIEIETDYVVTMTPKIFTLFK
jgi:hypothetical protein